jgi:hypothetical protein
VESEEIQKLYKETAKLLDEKIDESRLIHLGETPESTEEFNKAVCALATLKNEILSRLESRPTNFFIFDGLSRAMHDMKLPNGWAGEVFAQIETEIRYKYRDESHYLSELKNVAIEHFTTNLKADFNFNNYDDVENGRLVEILQQIKKKLKDMNSYEIKGFDLNCERFKFAALKKLQDELETEIAEREALAQQKKKFEIADEDNTDIMKKKTGKANPENFVSRTQRQVFLALEILIRHSLFAGNKTEKAKLMSFLSGYSVVQLAAAFSKSDNWDSNAEDLEYILKIFTEAGIKSKKILDEIRTEISKSNIQ